jgi:hypothetical protein
MPDIRHRLKIEASAELVYHAISTEKGLSGWWTENTTAKPELNTTARFAFDNNYFKEMKITELKPLKRVTWLCLAGYVSWIGTTISFEIEPGKNGCILSFQHNGWTAYSEGFAVCSYDWAMFLRSLKLLCETGKGLPWPHNNELANTD